MADNTLQTELDKVRAEIAKFEGLGTEGAAGVIANNQLASLRTEEKRLTDEIARQTIQTATKEPAKKPAAKAAPKEPQGPRLGVEMRSSAKPITQEPSTTTTKKTTTKKTVDKRTTAKWAATEAKFRSMFPAQAWLLDIDPVKYPDVRKVIENGVKNKAWETAESQARFVAEFNNTSFYKELQSTGARRQVVAAVGELGFDSVPFNAFLTKAMNLGWNGDTLKAEAYKEAFRTDPTTGTFVNPTAVERVKKSNDYLQVANIGKAYFNQVADGTVQRVLTGEMSQDDVARQQRELAKSRYAHLSPLIDQGLSLQEIGDNYKTQAAQLLEKDPNSIDMSQSDYEVALNFGEPGQKRLMTQGEWQKLLRSDAKYGWEKTNNAKAEARKLSDSIISAFGKVL